MVRREFMFDKSTLETDTAARRLRALSDEACGENGYSAAESKLVASIESDPTLVTYAIQHTAHYEVRMSMAVRRQRIIGSTGPDALEGKLPKVYSHEVCKAVQDWGGKYLSWPMSCRKVLGDADVEDVRAEAEMYEANAQGNARNGRFFRLVEKRLQTLKAKPGEAAGHVLSDAVLEKLMAKAITE